MAIHNNGSCSPLKAVADGHAAVAAAEGQVAAGRLWAVGPRCRVVDGGQDALDPLGLDQARQLDDAVQAETIMVYRTRDVAEDSFTIDWTEIGYFRDSASGQPLQGWFNPSRGAPSPTQNGGAGADRFQAPHLPPSRRRAAATDPPEATHIDIGRPDERVNPQAWARVQQTFPAFFKGDRIDPAFD